MRREGAVADEKANLPPEKKGKRFLGEQLFIGVVLSLCICSLLILKTPVVRLPFLKAARTKAIVVQKNVRQ